MIKLYQFRRTWGLPNQSHFCCKVETYLRFAKLEYIMVPALPTTSPKGKLPFIVDGENTVADSDFIIRYLKEQYGDPLDKGLSAEEKALSTAIQRICEDHLFWATMYTRWNYSEKNWAVIKDTVFHAVPLPGFIVSCLARFFRWQIRRQIFGQGLGRHLPAEVFQLARDDIDTLSTFLGDKAFFLGRNKV